MLARLAGRPVTVRTLDFAEDKLPPFLADRGPLGRSLPLMLADPEALGTQVRAVLLSGAARRAHHGADGVSAGSCGSVGTWCARIAAEVGRRLPPVGAMVETREAVAGSTRSPRSPTSCRSGTNDLAASVLGRDRRDPSLDSGQRARTGGAGRGRGDRGGGGAARPRR